MIGWSTSRFRIRESSRLVFKALRVSCLQKSPDLLPSWSQKMFSLAVAELGRQVTVLVIWPKTNPYPWTLWFASNKQYMRNSLSRAFNGLSCELGFKAQLIRTCWKGDSFDYDRRNKKKTSWRSILMSSLTIIWPTQGSQCYMNPPNVQPQGLRRFWIQSPTASLNLPWHVCTTKIILSRCLEQRDLQPVQWVLG